MVSMAMTFFFFYTGKMLLCTPLHPRHSPNQDERGLRGSAELGGRAMLRGQYTG